MPNKGFVGNVSEAFAVFQTTSRSCEKNESNTSRRMVFHSVLTAVLSKAGVRSMAKGQSPIRPTPSFLRKNVILTSSVFTNLVEIVFRYFIQSSISVFTTKRCQKVWTVKHEASQNYYHIVLQIRNDF